MKKTKLVLVLAAAAVALTAAAAAVTMAAVKQHNYREAHVFVEDREYPADAEQLDLRGTPVSRRHFEMLSGKLPQCRILWDVPFQKERIPSDTQTLTVTELTEEDGAMLAYFPQLQQLDATACRDYDVIMLLREKRPRCRIRYHVEIGSQTLPDDAVQLQLASGESSAEELMERLPYLKELRSVHFQEPQIPAEQLKELTETFPHIRFTWKKTLFEKQLDSSTKFLDLSGKKFESLQQVRAQAAYLPELEQIDMLNCGFSNKEMRKFRDQVREDYKVVWNVQVGTMDLRTDIQDFFPDRDHGKVRNADTENLRYCEDLICVDVGHLGFSNLDWVEGTPHLKYLIMSDSGAQDLTPLGKLQELEFLELFMTGVSDTSPLVNCKNLKDLNLCRAPLGDITPLTKMTWLEKLWVSHCPLDTEERERLKRSLPNTHIEFDEYYSTWGGWRDMPRYFEMRDFLHVPYMR